MKHRVSAKTMTAVVVLLVVVASSIGIAYAALQESLAVSYSNVTQNGLSWSVGFTPGTYTGVATGNTSRMDCGSLTATHTAISDLNLVLTKQGDSCAYEITLANTGTIDAMINTIATTSPEDTSCEVTGSTLTCGAVTYQLKNESSTSTSYVASGDIIEAQASKKIYLVATYTGTEESDDFKQNGFGFTITFTQH